jgi:2-phosphosulfolactate phosphatase
MNVNMETRLEVLLSPAEFEILRQRDLRGAVCVVLDILRATTSMVTALHADAQAIIPVTDIPEALALRRQRPEVLLAGERNGLRIPASLTGGTEFDLGNSPREFTPERVRGKTIVMTTTNGTRALRACAGAGTVLAACFLNLRTVTDWLRQRSPQHLVVVCAGTFEEAALEDTLAAGALCHSLWGVYEKGQVADAAQMARLLYAQWQPRLLESMSLARNGRRLLAHPDLKDDVRFCLQQDILALLAQLQPDGSVTKAGW